MASYKYRALDLDLRSFKLLKFLEGNLGDGIQCELLVGRIDESKHYDALSYTLGSKGKLDTIMVDGSSVRATSNAY